MILLHPVYIIIHLVYYYNNVNEELLKNVKSNQKRFFGKSDPKTSNLRSERKMKLIKQGFCGILDYHT